MHAESLHPDPHRQALEALGSIVLCVHTSLPAATAEAPPPAAVLAPPATAALAQALPLLFAAISSEYDRSIVGSALTAFATLCGGLPPGSLAHAAPALVDAIEGAHRFLGLPDALVRAPGTRNVTFSDVLRHDSNGFCRCAEGDADVSADR